MPLKDMQAFMWQADLLGVAKNVHAVRAQTARVESTAKGVVTLRVKHLSRLVWLEEM